MVNRYMWRKWRRKARNVYFDGRCTYIGIIKRMGTRYSRCFKSFFECVLWVNEIKTKYP